MRRLRGRQVQRGPWDPLLALPGGAVHRGRGPALLPRLRAGVLLPGWVRPQAVPGGHLGAPARTGRSRISSSASAATPGKYTTLQILSNPYAVCEDCEPTKYSTVKSGAPPPAHCGAVARRGGGRGGCAGFCSSCPSGYDCPGASDKRRRAARPFAGRPLLSAQPPASVSRSADALVAARAGARRASTRRRGPVRAASGRYKRP